MSKPECSVCGSGKAKKVAELYYSGKGRRTIAKELGFTERNIRTHLSHLAIANQKDVAETPVNEAGAWKAGVEITGDSGYINTGTVSEPVTDWTELLLIWGLSPEEFEVLEPVTFKAWDSFAKEKLVDGTELINTIRLYSYRARIQRKSKVRQEIESSFDFNGWRKTLQNFNVRKATPLKSEFDPSTYAVMIADPQLGKEDLQGTIDRWKHGVEKHIDRIHHLLKSGHNIADVAICFMGDEHEGVAGNYGSQQFEVVLNMSEQLELDFDLSVWTVKQFLKLGLPIKVTSVVSNHGSSWVRAGTKGPVTSEYDNSSTFVRKMVKKVFDETDFDVEWFIAETTPNVIVNFSGVDVYLTHGHIEKGSGKSEQKVKSAFERQILGRTEELHKAKLFVGGHYHHMYVIEDRGRTFIGCPSLEGEKASDWFYSQYGTWSRPGLLGLLIGDSQGSRGYGEVAVF